MFCGEVFKRKSKLCKKLRRMYLTVLVEKVDLNMNIGKEKLGKITVLKIKIMTL